MGWGAGNIGGGGSGGLNFRIVGGTSEPSNPRENLIWVNTDVKITSWVFSANEPENPESGMIWISTGSSSPVAFNALKKNGIVVFPISAKQYIAGESTSILGEDLLGEMVLGSTTSTDSQWVDVTAKSYQGGEWVDWWNGELYDNGKEFETQTGGWRLWGGSGLTKYSDHMTLYNAGLQSGCVICTTNKIDLSMYSTLNVEFERTSGNNFGISVVENTEANPKFVDFWDKSLAVKEESATSGVSSLDISDINKQCYIAIGGVEWSAFTVNIKKVWLS